MIRRIGFLWCILFCLMLVSCDEDKSGDSKEIVIPVSNTVVANKLFYDVPNFNFCMDFLYNGEKPDIQIRDFIGEDLKDIELEGKVIVEDFAEELSYYKGYMLCTFLVTADIGNEKTTRDINIEGVRLTINDKDKDIYFDEPLFFSYQGEKKDSEDLEAYGTPVAFMGIDTVLSYTYVALNDVEINKIDTTGIIDINNTNIYVNDSLIGDLNNLPICIKKGDKIEFEIYPGLLGEEKNWTSIYTNFIINYKAEDRLEEYTSDLMMLPIDSKEDIIETIDNVI